MVVLEAFLFMFIVMAAIFLVVVSIGVGFAVVQGSRIRDALWKMMGRHPGDPSSDMVSEAVQSIMTESRASARLGLCLKNCGIDVMPNRDGKTLVRNLSGGSLTAMLAGRNTPGMMRATELRGAWPSKGVWVSDEDWKDVLAELPLHPVDIIRSVLARATALPFEPNILQEAILSTLGKRNPRLVSQLHAPLSLLTAPERNDLVMSMREHGLDVREGDMAVASSVASLLESTRGMMPKPVIATVPVVR